MRNLYVSAAPHIKTKESISTIMRDVIIALIPTSLAGIVFFGYRALAVILTAVAACVLSEYAYNKLAKKHQTVSDLSAVVTGVLIGLNMPPAIPLWMVVVGSIFAIVVVKQLYGGLGKNFLNPALAARCFMLIAWTGDMTSFSMPFSYGIDAMSSATPLAVMKGTAQGDLPSLLQSFIGFKAGCIGEVSAVALLIGFAYLVIRRVVRLDTPLSYILTFFVLTFIGEDFSAYTALSHVLSGGLLLGAFFMATDYVTTPTTPKGHIIFGIGCGVLTFVIRKFGGYPEGVSFSILLMNVVSPIIETYTMPKPFGYAKEAKNDK